MSKLLDKDGVLLDASTIRFERLLPGPIERVWAYLTESGKRKQWIAAGDFELRNGGKMHLFFHHKNISKQNTAVPEEFRKMNDEGEGFDGEVLAVEAPRLLTITWGGDSEVTFELTPQSNNEVLLTVTHRKLTDDGMKYVLPGWHVHLGLLADILNGEETRDFWADFQKLFAHYAESAK